MLIIGIDPGKKGAIVEIDVRQKWVRWMKLPYREDGLLITKKLKDYFDFRNAGRIALEEVCYIKGCNGQATFSFGESYGKVKQMLEEYPFELVRPQAWHKRINGAKDGDERDTKTRSKATFIRMNPDFGKIVKEHHEGMIDAFFIAYYTGLKAGIVMPQGFTFDQICDQFADQVHQNRSILLCAKFS